MNTTHRKLLAREVTVRSRRPVLVWRPRGGDSELLSSRVEPCGDVQLDGAAVPASTTVLA